MITDTRKILLEHKARVSSVENRNRFIIVELPIEINLIWNLLGDVAGENKIALTVVSHIEDVGEVVQVLHA